MTVLWLAGGSTMLSADWSDGVRLGPDGVRLGPMGSDWVISHTGIQDVKIIHSLRNSEVRLHKVPHFTFLPKPKGGVIKCNSIRRKKACICVNKHFAIAITN